LGGFFKLYQSGYDCVFVFVFVCRNSVGNFRRIPAEADGRIYAIFTDSLQFGVSVLSSPES
jgi:hypothetical protein